MGFKDLINFIKSIVETLKDALDGAEISEYQKILNIPVQYVFFGEYNENPSYGHTTSDMNNIFVSAYDAIFVLAAIFITIAFFQHIYNLIYNEQLTMESLIKHCIVVCVLFIILGNGPVIVSYFYEFFDTVGRDITTTLINNPDWKTTNGLGGLINTLFGIDTSGGIIHTFVKSVLNGGLIGALMHLILSVVMAVIMSVIVRLALAKNGMERAIRLVAYIVLMPFAVCQVYSQNNNILLTKYLRNIGVLVLEQYLIIFEIVIINQVCDFLPKMSLLCPAIIGQLMAFMLTVSAINNAKDKTSEIFS